MWDYLLGKITCFSLHIAVSHIPFIQPDIQKMFSLLTLLKVLYISTVALLQGPFSLRESINLSYLRTLQKSNTRNGMGFN